MPEGPEVRTVASTLAHELIGKKFGELWHSHHRLRRAVDYSLLAELKGMSIDAVSCYGKILFIDVNNKPALYAQLGMTGQLVVTSAHALVAPHTHVRWALKDTGKELRYIDPRRFGLIEACDEKIKKDIIKKLGPDPFSLSEKDFSPLRAAMKRSNRAIKDVLMDQSIVVGVGNIYASEALFLAKINPQKSASEISIKKYDELIKAIIVILELAFKNCGTTFSNYVDGSGKKGDNLRFLKVFQREGEPCTVCISLILRIKQSGRSTFFCPQCQQL